MNDLGNCEVRTYNPDAKVANLFVYKLESNETNHGKIHKSRKIEKLVLKKQYVNDLKKCEIRT